MLLGISQLGVDWILGPGGSFALYAFRIISPVVLSETQLSEIVAIATYMKPAHTHLLGVVQPTAPPPPYDPMVLGVSLLGVDWLLHHGPPSDDPMYLGVSLLGIDWILHDGPHFIGLSSEDE